MTAVDGEDEVQAGQALLGRGSVYLVATACQVLGSFLALPLLTRLLGADEFGLVASAVVVTQILRVLAEGGLSTAITLDYFAHDGPARARRLAGASVALAVLVTAGAHVTGPLWIRAFAGLSYDRTMELAVWSAPALVALVAGQAVLRAQARARAFVMSAAVATIGAQALGLGAAAIFAREPAFYLLGVLVGYVAGGFTACWCARISFSFRGHLAELPPALQLAWPSIPHSLALYVLQAGDRVVIQRADGLTAVGRYQAAYLVGAAVISVLSAVNNAWAPLIYGAAEARRDQTLRETTRILLQISSWAVVGLACAAPALLRVAAPASYRAEDLVPVAAVVSLSAIPFCLYLANVHTVFVSRSTRMLAVVTPAAAIANIGLNLVLVAEFGLVGAAAATVVAYGVQAGLLHRTVRRSEPLLGAPTVFRSVGVAVTGVIAGSTLPMAGWAAVSRLGAVIGVLCVLQSIVRREIHR